MSFVEHISVTLVNCIRLIILVGRKVSRLGIFPINAPDYLTVVDETNHRFSLNDSGNDCFTVCLEGLPQ